jgi:hypothetical protein
LSALRRTAARIGPGTAAIVALALAWGTIMHASGWAQLASFSQVRAFADGQAEIDPWHWQTKDKAYIDGHFYSVKAPGLAAWTLLPYLGLDAAGGDALAQNAADNAATSQHTHWQGYVGPPYDEYGFSESRSIEVRNQVEGDTPMVWALTLFGAVLPATLLLFAVRYVANRIEPGYGTAAAITLGIGTILLTFAAEYFPHAIAATLGFGAFALLFRERQGPPRAALVGLGGLLAGLAVTFEYPLGLVGIILFVYALSRTVPRLRRAAAYTGGAVAGALPALVFNLWAFGNPFQFAYGDAVTTQGFSGHAELGMNDDGLFGITAPGVGEGLDLLLASRGLLTLTPVIAMGIAGAILMRRRAHRAESTVVLAVCLTYFIYNAGYWLPYGGGTPGPRFLIPALPFLALGLAPAWRRWPVLTLALAIPSALYMLAATITLPLIGNYGTGTWADRLWGADLEHTLLTALGVELNWLAILPFLAAVGGAIALAVAATPRSRVESVRPALIALSGWVVVAVLGPVVVGDDVTPLSGGAPTLWLIGSGALLSAGVLLALRGRRRPQPAEGPVAVPAPALGERIS